MQEVTKAIYYNNLNVFTLKKSNSVLLLCFYCNMMA